MPGEASVFYHPTESSSPSPGGSFEQLASLADAENGLKPICQTDVGNHGDTEVWNNHADDAQRLNSYEKSGGPITEVDLIHCSASAVIPASEETGTSCQEVGDQVDDTQQFSEEFAGLTAEVNLIDLSFEDSNEDNLMSFADSEATPSDADVTQDSAADHEKASDHQELAVVDDLMEIQSTASQSSDASAAAPPAILLTDAEVSSFYVLSCTFNIFVLMFCCIFQSAVLISILSLMHTHTHPFNGPLSGTTRVSRYQKGKTSLDFTGARDSEWQWHQLGHMQVCTSLQTDNHASTSPLSFLQAGCPSCRPTNSVKALKATLSLMQAK